MLVFDSPGGRPDQGEVHVVELCLLYEELALVTGNRRQASFSDRLGSLGKASEQRVNV